MLNKLCKWWWKNIFDKTLIVLIRKIKFLIKIMIVASIIVCSVFVLCNNNIAVNGYQQQQQQQQQNTKLGTASSSASTSIIRPEHVVLSSELDAGGITEEKLSNSAMKIISNRNKIDKNEINELLHEINENDKKINNHIEDDDIELKNEQLHQQHQQNYHYHHHHHHLYPRSHSNYVNTNLLTKYDDKNNNNNKNNIGDNENSKMLMAIMLKEKIWPAIATPKPPTTNLNDIFISVKTTKQNHDNRLELILDTWHQLAKQQIWFFTDENDQQYQQRTNSHLINTNCSNGHFRRALCCKMSMEFDMFIESNKKWFCHFDDDNYVNVPRLVNLLNEYSPKLEWYLGKPSVSSPLEIHIEYKKRKASDSKVKFWFATGGAGFCLSRALALRMQPIAGGGKLMSIGDRIRFPDDVTLGFIIEHLLGVPLTVVDQFHSHLEQMEFIERDTFRDQVSFSYGRIANNDWNVINLDGFKSKLEDPTRFRSLHCYLFGCEKEK